jgi:hypothetical protein
MHKFSRFLITFPVLVLPLVLAAPKPALAETVGMERALELLAKSKVVDGKCNVLTMSEREELSSYVARAEVAAAEKTTLEVTRSALDSGKSQGQDTPCGAEASQEVRDTLAAARVAIKTAEKTSGAMVAEEPPSATQPVWSKPDLATYSRVMETYFVERRCAYLSQRKVNAYYKAVVKVHKTVIAEFGKAAVAKLMKSAEARSNYQSCNGMGEARVRAGFAEVASR